mmetsp:Transcript_20967/g.37601  ORF Transcript_20967/g.37601 Transcript_20967/m.37601 type:complete len:98 (-) Transcript_20967:76-369(-)
MREFVEVGCPSSLRGRECPCSRVSSRSKGQTEGDIQTRARACHFSPNQSQNGKTETDSLFPKGISGGAKGVGGGGSVPSRSERGFRTQETVADWVYN